MCGLGPVTSLSWLQFPYLKSEDINSHFGVVVIKEIK